LVELINFIVKPDVYKVTTGVSKNKHER